MAASTERKAPDNDPPKLDIPWPKDRDLMRRIVPGPDGQVWAFAGTDDEESVVWKVQPLPASKINEWEDEAVRALATSSDGKRIAVGFDEGTVQIYSDPGLSSYFKAPHSDGTIRALAFHPRHSYWLAIASESGLTMVNADTEETIKTAVLESKVQEAHKSSGIRSVQFLTTTDTVLLSTLSMDGRHCLWDLTGPCESWDLLHREESCCITKRDRGESLGADPWVRSCQAAFGRLSDRQLLLLLPGEPFLQMRTIAGRSVTESNSSAQVHTESIVVVVVRGKQAVTSGRDGKVLLWSLMERSNGDPVAELDKELYQLDSAPTDVKWMDDSLYIACADGTMMVHKIPQKATIGESKTVYNSSSSRLKKKETLSQHQQDSNSDDDDDDVDFTQKETRNPFVEDEAADDDALGDSHAGQPRESSPRAIGDDSTVGDHDDHRNDESLAGGEDDDSLGMPQYETSTSPLVSLPTPQPPFAPSSTPLDLDHRIMCWNHMGTATWHRDSDSGRNSVDIHFTNAAFARPIRFTDTLGFLLGSLGEDGGIFCTDVDEGTEEGADGDVADVVAGFGMKATKAALTKTKNGAGSTVYFHRFETIGAQRDKDWYLTLPDGERAVGCATGEGWAAVITSRRFLRLFSSGGNQGEVIWLDGEPVSIAGRGRFLAVFYHSSSPLFDGTQKINFMLYDAVSHRTIGKGPVSCISSKGSLSWVGYSNDFSLLAFDSAGILSMLTCQSEDVAGGLVPWEWMPILDTVGLRKSTDDNHWPITAVDGKLVCVPLKGGAKYPEATRRPVTTVLGFRLPLARSNVAKVSVLEELSVRANLSLRQKKVVDAICCGDEDELEDEYVTLSAQVDKVVLKQFAALMEAKKFDRALDLVQRLHLEKSFELAKVVADKHDKLVIGIEKAMELRFGDDDEDDGLDASYDSPPSMGTMLTSIAYKRRITPDSRSLKRSVPTQSNFVNRRVRPKT